LRILKIGGSLITEKKEGAFEVAKVDVMERLAKALRGERDLILVHGVGSFGHPHVRRYGIKSPKSVSKIHNACLRLNTLFCSILEENGLSVVPVHPLEFFAKPDYEFLKKLVNLGFVPVLHGDVIIEGESFRVISGDEVVRILSEVFEPETVGFASDSEVLYDGKIVETVDESNYAKIVSELKGAVGKDDVTGGMLKKFSESLRIAKTCDVYIFSEKNLRKFLRGEIIPTRIKKGNYKI